MRDHVTIKTVSISEIKTAKYNPRKDLGPEDSEYQKLERSMAEFGYLVPLVWNERTGRLVGGHQRLKILKKEGFSEVEVSVVDLGEIEERALNVAMNRVKGKWDFELLEHLLVDLEGKGFDIELTGFEESELQSLLSWSPNFEPVSEESTARLDQKDPYVCPQCGKTFPRE